MLAKPVAFCFVPSEPIVFRNYSFSLILLNPSSVVQMIWSLSAMLISVFIVPVVSFPQTTTILHRLKIWWDILRMACISSASPSRHQGMGKSCTASRSAHIPVRRSSGSTAVLWSFLLLQNSRHKQVPVPIRPSPFLTGQFSSARYFPKKKHPQSIPALWMSCGHLDSFLPFFRCLADIRLLWFFILCFCPGFQCDTDTVASQLIICIRHFDADCLIARLCRRKDGRASSGKRV